MELAAEWGRAEALKFLIGRGESVEAFGAPDQGGSPLLRAAKSRQPECVRILLDAGASPASVPLGEKLDPAVEALIHDARLAQAATPRTAKM